MAKARSPAYPAIGLREAVEHVSNIYHHDYQNPIPRAVAAGHMGYQGLNGKSLGVLSALLKYELLEGRGDNTRVSDLAVNIIAHPPGSAERVAALELAGSCPDLFAELNARSQGGKISDQALRSYLLTQKFIPAAADAAIRSYRETIEFIESERPRASGTIDQTLPRLQGFGAPTPSSPPLEEEPEPSATEFRLSISQDRVTVTASLRTQEAADALIARLAALKAFLPEKKESGS